MNQTITQILSDPTYDPPETILSLNLNGDLRSIIQQLSKEVCVAFAVGEAKLVLPIFESEFPNDDRPKRAIEAAEEWLKDPSSADATRASIAAYAADAYAAYAAAARAAYRAAADAAHAVYTISSAYAADSAAFAAAAADTSYKAIGLQPSLIGVKKDQFIRLFNLLKPVAKLSSV